MRILTAKNKILVTGATGFAGSHLLDFLSKRKGLALYGTRRWRSVTGNIDHLFGKVEFTECDICDATSVNRAIDEYRPHIIFHLAAQSFVPTSWHSPAETFKTNIIGQVNLFEAVRRANYDPTILIAGSSEEYGLVEKEELPIKETNALRPLSPYAVSKVGQDLLGYQYFKSYGMKIIRTRAFNHTGPRRPPVFVCSGFAKQVAEIEKEPEKPVIKTGNLEAVRDFTDVRDIVRGYWLAATEGEPGEVYNICSGVGYKIESVLKMLLKIAKVEVKIKKDPERMRPSDVPILVGDSSKFRELTGWEPKIPFANTLGDLLDYWNERVL